jgi:Bacterial Ig domain/Pentapeptide repeats (8 copies)
VSRLLRLIGLKASIAPSLIAVCLSLVWAPTAFGHGIPDQVNDPVPEGSLHGFPTCQSFVPTKTPLVAVDLRFVAGGSFPDTGFTTTVAIRPPNGFDPNLGEASASIAGPLFPGQQVLVHFDFSPALTVAPGSTYLIEWESTSVPDTVMSWAASFENPYAPGSFVNCDGSPFPPFASADLNFITYALADTTPPVLNVPDDITTFATSPGGAVVNYTVTASDPDDTASTPSCSPASGSVFPGGTTAVTCTSTDTNGNTGTASFRVAVIPLAILDHYTLTSGQTLSVAAPGPLGNDFGATFATFTPVTSPTSGTLTSNGSGAFSYAPNKGFVGTDLFTYRASLENLLSNPASVVLSVLAPGADCNLDDYPLVKDATGLDLRGANLGGCFLPLAQNLANADASNANFRGADLNGARLTGANLKQVNLAGALLRVANLTDANLSGATLLGADMFRAILSGVVWSQTTCPDGTISNADGGTCIDHLG